MRKLIYSMCVFPEDYNMSVLSWDFNGKLGAEQKIFCFSYHKYTSASKWKEPHSFQNFSRNYSQMKGNEYFPLLFDKWLNIENVAKRQKTHINHIIKVNMEKSKVHLLLNFTRQQAWKMKFQPTLYQNNYMNNLLALSKISWNFH